MRPDPPPPGLRRGRGLLWPALALAALVVLPPTVVLAIGASALLARVIWRDVRHVRARDARIDALAARAGAIPLGHDPRGRPVAVPPEALAAHGLIVGATGSGKTTTLTRLLSEQLGTGAGVVVIDLKGSPTFAAQMRAAAEAAGRRFVQWTPDGGASWNPLAHGNATELKDKLLATEHFSEPHYRRAAERYLQLAIQVAQESDPGQELTLSRVVSLLSPERLAIAARRLPDARAQQLREYLGSLTPDQHSAVRGLGSRLAVLTESHTGRFLEPGGDQPGLDLRAALDGGEVVLFSLNSSTYGGLAGMLGTLAVQDLVAAAGSRLSESETASEHPQAVVAIDEFSALRSDNLLALLARGRESRVGVLLATQELADLDRAGPGFRDQVLGDTALKIAHRQDVPSSARMVAELAGTVRVWERSYQESGGRLGQAGRASTSARLTERYVVEPELVRTLGTGDAVVIVKSPSASVRVTRVQAVGDAPPVRTDTPAPPPDRTDDRRGWVNRLWTSRTPRPTAPDQGPARAAPPSPARSRDALAERHSAAPQETERRSVTPQPTERHSAAPQEAGRQPPAPGVTR